MTADEQVKGLDLSARAKQLAEDLGFGPSGKSGGVIVIIDDHLAEVKAIAGEARARVREVEAELHAVLGERERCRTLLVRSQLVAEDVGVEEGSEDLDRASDYLRDVRAYLHEVANA